jgi:hypothetical protein
MTTFDSIRDRAARLRLPHRVWAVLASDGQPLKVHTPEISNWLSGIATPRPEKVEQLLSSLAEIERLVAADPTIKIVMDVENLRAAFARLAEKDAAELAAVKIAPPAIAMFKRDPREPAESAKNAQSPAATSLLSREGQ